MPVNGVTPPRRPRPTVGQVRRAYELVAACADRGDDHKSWTRTLAIRLPELAGLQRLWVVFPDAGVVAAPRNGGGSPPRRAAERALVFARSSASALRHENRRAAGGPFQADDARAAWAWRDANGRTAALLAAGSEPAGGRECGGVAQGEKLVTLTVRGLSRLGPRLSHPGEPAPGDLPPKTREVLCRLLRGQLEKEIAAATHVSAGAVHKHVHKIYRHFGVSSRGGLLARWLQRGWGRTCDWRPPPADRTRHGRGNIPAADRAAQSSSPCQ